MWSINQKKCTLRSFKESLHESLISTDDETVITFFRKLYTRLYIRDSEMTDL